MKVKSESKVIQLCPTLSDPMDCSLPGSSVHGIFQARVLEWGAIAFSAPKQKTGQMVTKTRPLYMLSTRDPPQMFAGILSAEFSQHHLLGFEIAELEFHYLHSLCS